jgi:hypothetical protein
MLYPGVANCVQMSADGAVGTSGVPTVIWTITVFADVDATFTMRNGTTTGGTALWGPETGAAVVGARHYVFPNGMFFPSGCFYDEGTAGSIVSFTYNQMPFSS